MSSAGIRSDGPLPTDFGILSFGAYLPRARLQRKAIAAANAWFAPGLRGLAKGERAICNWDEDSITMGVEAARDCLAGFDRQALTQLVLASSTLPFDDRQNAGVVANALQLQSALRSMDQAGSQRAGSTALAAALDGGGAPGLTLVIAADARKSKAGSTQEMHYGDGAAAMLVGHGEPIARLIGVAQRDGGLRAPVPHARPRPRLRLGRALGARRGLPEDRAARGGGAAGQERRRCGDDHALLHARHAVAHRRGGGQALRPGRRRGARQPGRRVRRHRRGPSAAAAGRGAGRRQAGRPHPAGRLRRRLRCAAVRSDAGHRQGRARGAASRARWRPGARTATTCATCPSTT